MNRRTRSSRVIPLALLLSLCALPPSTHAIQLLQTNTWKADKGIVLEQETLVFAQAVDFEGTANDDLFLVGVTNTLGGSAHADVWSLATVLNVEGRVADDLRALGNRVQVSGQVGGDLLGIGARVQCSERSTIAGSALLVGEQVVVDGVVSGDLRIHARRATLAGQYAGDVHVEAEEITVLREARFEQDLRYRSGSELFLDKQVELGGELQRLESVGTLEPGMSLGQFLTWKGILLLAAVLVGVPLLGLFPHYSARGVRLLRFAPWRCLLVGLLVFCVLPLFALVSMATLVGLPLGLLLAGIFLAMVYTSKIIVALVLGGLVLRREGAQSFGMVLVAMGLGLLFLYFLTLLPMLGIAVWLVTVLSGMGALTLALLAPRQPVFAHEPAVGTDDVNNPGDDAT